jgi:hypothetical protein
MKTYLEQAEKMISPKITGIVRRNRVVARATNIYITDPAKMPLLFDRVVKDIIGDEYRATHYGKPIGTHIGWITSPKTKEFYRKVAKVKRTLLNLAREQYA